MKTHVVSDAVRNEVWGLLCDLERNVRYYGTLADRYRLRYRGIRYFLLLGVLAAGFIFYLLSGSPLAALVAGGLLAFLLGFLTVFDAVTNYAEVAAELRLASERCKELGVIAARLWRDVETGRVSDADAEERLLGIVDQWFSAARMVSLEVHEHENERAAIAAHRVVADRYAL